MIIARGRRKSTQTRPRRVVTATYSCFRLSLPGGRMEQIDGEVAHAGGDHGSYTTAEGECIHVNDDRDGDSPGGDT